MIPRELSVICCWQQEQVERKVPLICPTTALGRPICCCRYWREVWGRKCKTNPVRLSGLPTELGGPIYTDPLPPNVPTSEQKYRTDAALVCLHLPSVYRRTEGLRSTLGRGTRIRPVTSPPLLLGTFYYPISVNPFRLSLFLKRMRQAARTPAAVGMPRHRFYKRAGFFRRGALGAGLALHQKHGGTPLKQWQRVHVCIQQCVKVKREKTDIPGDGGRTDSIISIRSGWAEGGGSDRTNRGGDAEGVVAASAVCLSPLIQ